MAFEIAPLAYELCLKKDKGKRIGHKCNVSAICPRRVDLCTNVSNLANRYQERFDVKSKINISVVVSDVCEWRAKVNCQVLSSIRHVSTRVSHMTMNEK